MTSPASAVELPKTPHEEPRENPVIRVSNVTYDYPGLRALDDVSFELRRASITALVGPNGAGKTTLLRTMAALDEPMDGSIVVDGLDVWQQPREAHRSMGYLPDHFGLYKDLSARRCLLYAAYTRGLDRETANEAAKWAAQKVDLLPKLEALAGTLSRGQRQRLALAQAIVHRPKVLFLDEPASGLDPQARGDLSAMMKALAADGMTLLISSHILAELESYCTAMLVLEKGKLLAHETLHATGMQSEAHESRSLRIALADAMQREEVIAWAQTQGWRGKAGEAPGTLFIEGDFDDAAQSRMLRELIATGKDVLEFSRQMRNLQDRYLETVGHRKDS